MITMCVYTKMFIEKSFFIVVNTTYTLLEKFYLLKRKQFLTLSHSFSTFKLSKSDQLKITSLTEGLVWTSSNLGFVYSDVIQFVSHFYVSISAELKPQTHFNLVINLSKAYFLFCMFRTPLQSRIFCISLNCVYFSRYLSSGSKH